MNTAKFKKLMIALLAIASLALSIACGAASAEPRALNEAERALVEAFSVYERVGRYDYHADLVFSDTIDDGVFVFSDEEIARYGYAPITKMLDSSRISYSWYRGQGDWGRGVGIVAPDGVWIAEASAGTESASIVFLRDVERVGGIDVPPSVVNEMSEQELFDQLEATRAGYSDK